MIQNSRENSSHQSLSQGFLLHRCPHQSPSYVKIHIGAFLCIRVPPYIKVPIIAALSESASEPP